MHRALFILALLVAPALADDTGLPLDRPFPAPFVVSGGTSTGQAVVTVNGDKFLLRVFYATKDGTVGIKEYDLANRTPGPNPNPTPNPQPQPQPASLAYLYVIYESADASPQFVAVRDSAAWRDVLQPAGVRWLVVDQDEAAKKFPNATAKAKAVGLPAAVRIDSRGVAVAEKLPATPAEMATKAKAWVGGGK